MLTNLVRDLDDHDLSILHTQNTQNGLVGVACVNPLQKQISPTATDHDHGVDAPVCGLRSLRYVQHKLLSSLASYVLVIRMVRVGV